MPFLINPTPPLQVPRQALRDAAAVVLSSAELLEKYIDRLPQGTRDRQLAALKDAARVVQKGLESLLEVPA